MIQRAKSTLPPEARGACALSFCSTLSQNAHLPTSCCTNPGGAKPSASKKSSPYSAQNNAVKAGARKRSTGGQGTPAGGVPVDVQELDSERYICTVMSIFLHHFL